MFTVLDASIAGAHALRTGADRACDQCKQRKVRCDMGQPCLTCARKAFNCTYNKVRKKRGPTGRRISEIRRLQSGTPQSADPISGPQSVPDNDQLTEPDELTSQPNWSSKPGDGPDASSFGSSYSSLISPGLSQAPQSSTIFSDPAGSTTRLEDVMDSPSQGDFVFPSLPMDSPSDTFDTHFGEISQHVLTPLPEEDVWPATVNEETLLPWIDVYFKRNHPTIPILNRTNMYREMLLRKHRTNAQYGAMLLALCAFAMIQPVQIHERASILSRSAQAWKLLDECVKMRVAADFGENPSLESILTSFFLFACLFGSHKHNAAWHRLREAVDLAFSLGLHLPKSYENLDTESREQWLRTYLVLSVTERAYALQQRHSIDFRGRPGITARFMQAFDPSAATEYISSLIYQDQSDAVGMTGLLYLMETFDAINEDVIECWNGYCRYSDGVCESFDRRRALQMFRGQQRARDACLTGNISFAPSATPLPLAQLVNSQQADIEITQFWLLNRLWNLCLSHGLLRETSDHPELQYDFSCQVAKALLETCHKLGLAAMEVHGVGLVEKIYDVAMGIITAVNSSLNLDMDTILKPLDIDIIQMNRVQSAESDVTIRELLQSLSHYIHSFRGGDHIYSSRFTSALSIIPEIL